jgi:hypothetical protein
VGIVLERLLPSRPSAPSLRNPTVTLHVTETNRSPSVVSPVIIEYKALDVFISTLATR